MKRYIDPSLLREDEYVNLHGHSTYSVGDAIGYADEIVSSVIANGMNAVAITDHGNMNVVGDFYLHAKKIQVKNPSFKPIFGMEAYFHPDLDQWREDVRVAKEATEALKAAKKPKKSKTVGEVLDEALEAASEEIDGAMDSQEVQEVAKILGGESEGSSDGAGVEDEAESKSFDPNPAKRRHHLVLLAQNETGLTNLFKLNAFAQTEGLGGYGRQRKMPRIDFKMLERYNEGIVCTSACLAGAANYVLKFGNHLNETEEQILHRLENEFVGRMAEIFNRGEEPRFFLEIQFNAIADQHVLNAYLVKLHEKTGVPLVAAADFHYPQKDLFRVREIVKATNNSKDPHLHSSLGELEYHLYPKNARQMIEDYNTMDGGDYITPEQLLTAIRNSKYIADNLITKYEIDIAPKFPTMSFNPRAMMMDWLKVRLEELRVKRKWDKDTYRKYIMRVKEEMDLIDDKRFHTYFTTYKLITDKLRSSMLIGPGRGSGAGSLINYLLGITDVDPIKYNLRFDRFLDPYRVETVPNMLIL